MYLRTVKVRSSSGSINEYVRVVEAYRDNGKVKQRTLADLGRKDLLVEILPKLQRFLGGDRADTAEVEDPALSTCKNGRFSEVFCNLAPSSVVLGHGFSQKARVFDGFPC